LRQINFNTLKATINTSIEDINRKLGEKRQEDLKTDEKLHDTKKQALRLLEAER
jgi:hypothetical protein